VSRPDPSAWGVLESYNDYRGQTHRAPAATVARILEAMGAHDEHPPATTIQVITAEEELHSDTAIAIELEDGSRVRVADRHVPPHVPLGYHRLVHGDGTTSRLIVTPATCFLPPELKVWGWALQLYSTRSKSSWGIGDLHDLTRVARWARSLGAGAILLNPLSAVAPGVPQQESPYFPSSRCFLNPLYLRIEEVPGASSAGAQLSAAAAQGRALNSNDIIDRDAVLTPKMRALEMLWDSFGGDRGFDDYRTERGELLEGFATFMALADTFGRDRASWPQQLEQGDCEQVRGWRQHNMQRVLFHEWLQWHLDKQMAAAHQEIDLIQDLPVGVDPDGADAWNWRDVVATGMGVGAPPDELSTEGQNWGLGPFDPWKLRAAEYEPFIQTVRAALRHGSGLRVDHVMGLFRLYWIPSGMPSSAGTYVRYPATDLLNILALESHRAGAYIIGEDLGTVEAVVRQEMAKREMLSYRVMWFEDGTPSNYPRLSLGTVTNHDLPTIAGVWTGADFEEQEQVLATPNAVGLAAMRGKLQRMLDCDEEVPVVEVIKGAYRLLGRAPSMIVIATLEDALAVRRRPNIPGTTVERPNWSMSLPLTLEELEKDPLARNVAGLLSKRGACSGAAREPAV
jgi:4-alpha-glucanotransferase